jgi:hypothetical protein
MNNTVYLKGRKHTIPFKTELTNRVHLFTFKSFRSASWLKCELTNHMFNSVLNCIVCFRPKWCFINYWWPFDDSYIIPTNHKKDFFKPCVIVSLVENGLFADEWGKIKRNIHIRILNWLYEFHHWWVTCTSDVYPIIQKRKIGIRR